MDMKEYLGGIQLKAGLEIGRASYAESGTLGAIVYDANTGLPMILTNAHVAVGNEAEKKVVKKNVDLLLKRVENKAIELPDEVLEVLSSEDPQPIFHPKPDWLSPASKMVARIVAAVTRFDLDTDSAVCALLPGVKYIKEYDTNLQLMALAMYPHVLAKKEEQLAVVKVGKTTGSTDGVVKQVEGTNILIKGGDSYLPAHGDSGSLWVDPLSKKAVGLLHKGDEKFSYAYLASSVAQRLEIKFAPS